MSLTEAEGFADLAMWRDCWNVIAEMPPEKRLDPQARRLRIRCCIGLQLWGCGEVFAHQIKDGTDEDKRLAAWFYLLWAGCQPEFARDCIEAAVKIWPACRLCLLDDPVFTSYLTPDQPGE